MKICLPTLEDTGLEAALCGHFGQAPFFTLVDADTGRAVSQPNRGTHHGGGATPARIIAEAGAEVVLCGGLGQKAVHLLTESGIEIFTGAEGTVRQALEAWRAGRLTAANGDGACPDGESCH
ncbi:MAG: NifB/NifX family molybdenum-iron cluster-binding protein [Gemmatimonadota bacterium]